jgi:hypothetical protein
MQHERSSFVTTGDGIRIRYRFDGPRDFPVLVLSNSIGTDLHMWDAQNPAAHKSLQSVALIPRPTLVIAGKHGRVTTIVHGEEIASTIPGARLRVLPTVHLPNVEQPEDFVNEVLAFLLESE